MSYEWDSPEGRERSRIVKKIFEFLDSSGENRATQVRMCIAALGQLIHEPDQTRIIISEAEEVIHFARCLVLKEPHVSGFFTQAEIDEAKVAPNVKEICICTSTDTIEISKENECNPPYSPECNIFARIYLTAATPPTG